MLFRSVDSELLHWEREGESQFENVLVSVSLWCGNGLATTDMRLKVLSMVLLQKSLNLLGEEGEERGGLIRDHEVVGDLDFLLRDVEGCVAVELDGANAEVGSSEVDGEIETLDKS